MNKQITIVILLFEENISTVLECLKSIKDFKIIIVDNAGDQTKKKEITSRFNIYKYIVNESNIGFSKGNNLGIKVCDTEYILILNPDCMISKESVQKLKVAYDSYENCFMVSPTFKNKKDEIMFNASSFPEINSEQKILNISGDTCCQAVLGAAMFCKTSELKNIGMFDENFFIFYEDFDLCRRIRKLNKSIIQIKNADAYHRHGEGKSINNSFKRTFIVNYNMAYSELYYYFKINNHNQIFMKLKSKIPSYLFKTLINLTFFKLNKSIFYLSKIIAFFKFKNFIKNKIN